MQRELAAEKERTSTPLLGPLRRFEGADALSGGTLLDEAVPTPAPRLHSLLTAVDSPLLPQLAARLGWRQLVAPAYHHGHRQVRLLCCFLVVPRAVSPQPTRRFHMRQEANTIRV